MDAAPNGRNRLFLWVQETKVEINRLEGEFFVLALEPISERYPRVSEPRRPSGPSTSERKVEAENQHFELRDLAQRRTTAAILALVDIMNDEAQPSPTRIAAAEALLNCAWGRPDYPPAIITGATGPVRFRT